MADEPLREGFLLAVICKVRWEGASNRINAIEPYLSWKLSSFDRATSVGLSDSQSLHETIPILFDLRPLPGSRHATIAEFLASCRADPIIAPPCTQG